MTGFDVTTSDLTKSAKTTDDLAGRMRAVDLATPVQDLVKALPGAGAARSAEPVAQQWKADVAGLASQVAALSQGLSQCANNYDVAESSALHGFCPPGGD